MPRSVQVAAAGVLLVFLSGALFLMYALVGGPTRVAVVGDSIVALTRPALTTALGSDYTFEISGVVGATMGNQFAAISSLVGRSDGPPDAMVVELGTNDANGVNRGWRSSYDAEIRALDSVGCVVLVNVNDHVGAPYWSPAQNATAAGIDTAMLATSLRRPHFHLLDWASAVAAHPSWVDAGRIHPTEAGRRALAGLIVAALHDDCAA